MSELRNCPVCGKIFVKLVRNLCPDCIENEEQEFFQVREYLKDNAGASVEDITGYTGINEKKVLRWMREGRIEYTLHYGGASLTCDSCDAEINVGHLCAKCASNLANKLNSISKAKLGDKLPHKSSGSQDESKSGRMFVANRLRNEKEK